MEFDDIEAKIDELNDLLDDKDAQLEAEFRDLEQEAEVTQLKRKIASGGDPSSDDPLADLKGDLDGKPSGTQRQAREPTDAERFILVLCPKCKAKNRTNLERVRTHLPRCGRCREPLTFTKR